MNKILHQLTLTSLCLICFSHPVFADAPPSEQWHAEDYAQSGLLQFKWAKKFFFDRFTWSGDERVLDIGCGDGRLTHLITQYTPSGTVLGIDNSPSMIQHASQHYNNSPNLSFALEDAANRHFYTDCDAQFDVVVSFHCLHWVEEQDSVLQGISKALKPEGKAFLRLTSKGWDPIQDIADALIASDPWKAHFTTFKDPIHRYSKADYLRLVEEASLQAVRIEEVVEDDVLRDATALSQQVKSWLPHAKHLPADLQQAFLDDIVSTYLLKIPQEADGSIHLYDCYLEVELVRPTQLPSLAIY